MLHRCAPLRWDLVCCCSVNQQAAPAIIDAVHVLKSYVYWTSLLSMDLALTEAAKALYMHIILFLWSF